MSESGGEKVTCEGETSCEREGNEEINKLVGFRTQEHGSEPREQGNQEEVLRKRSQGSRLTAEEKGKGKL
ncbi:hypothetical protein Sjap_013577 [Stephania japonica]|uniref:Uncharacterized protein n=1 Tax=Stephania japonica TaxID=461633 RepID=A0AAP0IZD1_9MAGN